MAAREGDTLAPVGKTAETLAATSANFSISAGGIIAETFDGQLGVSPKKECKSVANLSLKKSACPANSAAIGLKGFYGDTHNDLFLSSLQTVMESSSELKMGVTEGTEEMQNAMEIDPELRVDSVKGDGEMQHANSTLQLRSPVPGDTASPSGIYSNLHSSSSSEGTLSALAAVGCNSSDKFSPESSNHHLPNMPVSSSSAAESTSTSPPSLSVCDDRCGVSRSPAAVLLSDMVATPSPYLATFSEEKSDVDMEGESHDSQVTCLWAGCHQQFSSLARLVVHLDRSHIGPMTQFICLWENCPRQLKPFDARYKLTTHLRCHTGEKPYHCEVATCKRSFSRLENLKLHTRTHTGEKPYLCHHAGCNKRFNNTSDRAKHMKTHITRKPYACKYPGCNKSYTDPSSMRKHIKYTHRVKEEVEDGTLSLPSLPRRKRSSLSCSSSSSSSSAPRTPQTQQQVQGALLMPSTSGNSLEDSLRSAVLQTHDITPHNPATQVVGAVAAPAPPPPAQLIPVVKLQGSTAVATCGGTSSPSLLLPAYKQSPPLMMIVPTTGSPAGTLPFSNAVSSSCAPAENISVSIASKPPGVLSPNLPRISLSSASQVIATTQAAQQSHALISAPPPSSSSSSSIEDQLRLHIVQLKQQLYQSQIVAAAALGRASTLPKASTSSAGLAPIAAEEYKKTGMPPSSSSTSIISSNRQLPILSSSGPVPILGSNIGEAKGTVMVSTSSTAPILNVAGANGTVLPPVLSVGGTNGTVLPQFIPIPIIHTSRIGMGSDAQFVYMSS